MEFPLTATFGTRSSLFLSSADDFHRHRHRVNRKLGKLRRALKIQTKDTKHYSEKEQISGITAENYEVDTRFGDVLLYQAERDLLYAEETRILLDSQTTTLRRSFVVSKYKRALKSVRALLEVTSGEKDADKRLELLALAAIVEGSLAIARRNWSTAVYALSVARCSLQYLYRHQTLPSGATRELYVELVDVVVDPALKTAALQSDSSNRNPDLLAFSRAHVGDGTVEYLKSAVELIAAKDSTLVSPAAAQQLIETVSWAEYSAKLSSEDVAKAIMSARSFEAQLDVAQPGSYDAALLAWQDALSAHTQQMDRSRTDEYDDDNQDQHVVLTYIKYHYLLLRIRRDVTVLAGIDSRTTKAGSGSRTLVLEGTRDALKVLENIAASVVEIQELPGVANDDSLSRSLESLQYYFDALKVSKLAGAHLVCDRNCEALALLQRAGAIVDKTEPFETDFGSNLPTNDRLEALRAELADGQRRVHVLAVYSQQLRAAGKRNLLIDAADEFPETAGSELLASVATLRTEVVPVGVKPVLFDVAFNYVKYAEPEPEQKQTEREEKDEGEKKKGFFGLFGR